MNILKYAKITKLKEILIRLIFTNRNCASSDLLTLAALHNRSATADALGQNRGNKLVPSTNSPQRQASPPRIRFLSSSVPIKKKLISKYCFFFHYESIIPVNFISGSIS